MKIIDKKYFLAACVLLIAIFSFKINAQPIKPRQLLKKVEASISLLNNVTYKINKSEKFFTQRDTVYDVAICSLYMAPKDEMKFYHIVDIKSSYKNTYTHYQYDGKYASGFWYKADSLNIPKKIFFHSVVEDGYDRLYSMGSSVILRNIFQKNNIFKQARSFLARFAIAKFEVKEQIFMENPVYVLSIYGKSREGRVDYVNNEVYTIYIRKSDFLPIGYKNYGELEGMKKYEYYEIEYLAINSKLSVEDFKVNTNLKEVKPLIYYERFQQYIN
ncbi:hypothetical protein CHU92_00550 [Flavobacterium cyanobacteriorum]|uniref:DUF1571 domain-containing protein n=1 Tax=Flavobacterium cyanobacteriorum TaxID=2022802 RepID=A0A256A6F9_9FLAO|nr:hypothetical protein [Flavobacterium cyanobacteriorum]OYQ48680.1 hypothetical protein CHU92_00550 [Flavobacterium cyanobacteriorum]